MLQFVRGLISVITIVVGKYPWVMVDVKRQRLFDVCIYLSSTLYTYFKEHFFGCRVFSIYVFTVKCKWIVYLQYRLSSLRHFLVLNTHITRVSVPSMYTSCGRSEWLGAPWKYWSQLLVTPRLDAGPGAVHAGCWVTHSWWRHTGYLSGLPCLASGWFLFVFVSCTK